MAHTVRDKQKLLNRIRRIRGQLDGIARALEEDRDCTSVLHVIAACRGAIQSLMGEVIDGHIRFHLVNPESDPDSEKSRAAQELIDVLKSYLR